MDEFWAHRKPVRAIRPIRRGSECCFGVTRASGIWSSPGLVDTGYETNCSPRQGACQRRHLLCRLPVSTRSDWICGTTIDDMSAPRSPPNGPALQSAPKIMPNGAAPIIIGFVSRAPAANSETFANLIGGSKCCPCRIFGVYAVVRRLRSRFALVHHELQRSGRRAFN
jgi:hypothetical protein